MTDTRVSRKISLQEAAERRDCSERTIRRYIATGLLTGYRMGPRLIRVDVAELDEMLRPIPTAGQREPA
jgi:excisionase family DNA binding protein